MTETYIRLSARAGPRQLGEGIVEVQRGDTFLGLCNRVLGQGSVAVFVRVGASARSLFEGKGRIWAVQRLELVETCFFGM